MDVLKDYLGDKAHDAAQARHLHGPPIHPHLARNGAVLDSAHEGVQESCLAGPAGPHHSSHLNKTGKTTTHKR